MLAWAASGAAAAPIPGDPGAAPAAQIDDIDGYTDEDVYASAPNLESGRQCRGVWARRNFKNLVGLWLWRYYEQIYFCWNGTAVTSFYRDRWSEQNSLAGFNPWSFDGHIGTNCVYEHCYPGRTGHWAEGAWTQGKYHACYLWVCNYRTPFVYVEVYGNGGYGYSTRG